MEKKNGDFLLLEQGELRTTTPTAATKFPWKAVIKTGAVLVVSFALFANLFLAVRSQLNVGQLQTEFEHLQKRFQDLQTATDLMDAQEFDDDFDDDYFEEDENLFKFGQMIGASFDDENAEISDVARRVKRRAVRHSRSKTTGVFHLDGREGDCDRMKWDNGVVRLPTLVDVDDKTDEVYKDFILRCWDIPTWINTEVASSEYAYDDRSGKITVKQEGIYYVYSQLFYLSRVNLSQSFGHGVFINDSTQAVFKCIAEIEATGVSGSDGLKYESCYTGGVEHLKPGDQLSVQNVVKHSGRLVGMSPSLSYWGIFKIQTVPEKKKSTGKKNKKDRKKKRREPSS